MGAGVVWVIGDWGREPRTAKRLFPALLIFGIVLSMVALLTAHYTIKSAAFTAIIDVIPVVRNIPTLNDLPPFNGNIAELPARGIAVISAIAGSIIGGGFNVNEIGGIMALLAPIAAAFAITRIATLSRGFRIVALLSTILLVFAIMLGQSRMAVIGVIGALSVLIFAVIPRGTYRSLALVALTALCLLEVGVVTGLFAPATADERFARDESSLVTRIYIWESAFDIMVDHPLTGVGINQFRARPVRDQYPVAGYESQVLPHAHNIFMQTGADLGLPGILLYLGWTLTLVVMLRRVWRTGGGWERTAAAAIVTGIAAHTFFNLADAIPLFDRFIFLYWVVIGLGAALYSYNGQQLKAPTSKE